ncbi:hypothetical protein SISSUDRAFT_1061002 [Sistotremastrum suecicum HHB10207 ss-3]|uniref:Peroxisome membrane anchor protein Pex14p N-terminal domain-containing protein n=1 Tax=Sistotremastrum suecicum HHB10207 ss-3 TaxID=1314776 RepID=A0A166EJA1_9AGAM|nr:hypothetical protein SISSUDRAFT_1061002 [Sistotremastrum suecicum HHB10207 ss-3]
MSEPKDKEHSQTDSDDETTHKTSGDVGNSSESRALLIEQARAFLLSSEIRNEDEASKRKFLAEKGLSGDEIDQMILEAASAPPPIPARTYPQPAPSRLPDLLIGMARSVAWFVGLSGGALIIYYVRKLILSIRFTQTWRVNLDSIVASAASLEGVQAKKKELANDWESLMGPMSLDDNIPTDAEGKPTCSMTLLLRAALRGGDGKTVAQLAKQLQTKFKYYENLESAQMAELIGLGLSDKETFEESDSETGPVYSLKGAAATAPPTKTKTLITSLSTLDSTMKPSPELSSTAAQHTLQTLTELTAYLSSETYTVPTWNRMYGSRSQPTGVEEDLRKDIRELRGHILTR